MESGKLRERGILSKYVIPLCKTLQWLPIFLKVKAQVSSGAPTTYLTSQPTSHLGLLTVPRLCRSLSQCWAFALRYSLPGEFFPSELTYHQLSSGLCSVTISEVLSDHPIQNSKPCNSLLCFIFLHHIYTPDLCMFCYLFIVISFPLEGNLHEAETLLIFFFTDINLKWCSPQN